MNNSIFETVKQRITMQDLVSHYGYSMNRGGFLRCPLHEDRTPSLKIYPDHFHCFSCGKSGDVVELFRMETGLTPLSAARQLTADFGLSPDGGFSFDRKLLEQIRKQKEEQEEKKQADADIRRSYRILTDYLFLLKAWRETRKPKSPDEPMDPLFAESLRKTDKIENYCDVILNDDRETAEISVRNNGKVVDEIDDTDQTLRTDRRMNRMHGRNRCLLHPLRKSCRIFRWKLFRKRSGPMYRLSLNPPRLPRTWQPFPYSAFSHLPCRENSGWK